jgi:hypothetical protein
MPDRSLSSLSARVARFLRHGTVGAFERRYAKRSGVTVEWLHDHGRYGAPCNCGDDLCEGWQMTHYEDHEAQA